MAIEQESLSRHERASAFLSAFTLAKTRLEQAVAQCKPGYDLGVLEDDVMGLQKMVTDAAGYLPSANLRGVQEDLKRIRADVAATRERLAPRKRFAFKTRAHLGDSTSGLLKDSASAEPKAAQPQRTTNYNTVGFQKRSGETLQLINIDGKDLELDSLENCNVDICGSPSTVFARDLVDCRIRCGPVSTSVFVERCTRCTFWLACQQLRVHQTLQTDFRVHIQSRSIIEDSSAIRFGRYDWGYDGDDSHWKTSGLNRDSNNWQMVDDFNWLAADKHSPNWTLMEDEP